MRLIPITLMLVLAAATGPAADTGLETCLEQLGVDAPAESLAPAPIPGFVEVIRGIQVLYVSIDGGLVINGDILSVSSETNLTEERRTSIRRDLLRSIPDDETLIVPASTPKVARVVIFTDLDCPYCLLLHRQHKELLRQGIEIQYLFYPRSGPASTSFGQAISVWCSKDRLAALDTALRGTSLPGAQCANPVARHLELAHNLELKGTPAVIAPDGAVHYGAHTPEEILDLVHRD